MKKIGICICILVVFCVFFTLWEINYDTSKKIKKHLVEQPELIEKKQIAKLTAFWFKNLKADFYWLQTIQYIGGNIIDSSYKNYLFNMIDLITELNPYFEEPYVIWELLLPSYNHRYEKLSKKTQKKYIDQAIELWKKAIDHFCDANEIKAIDKEDNLETLFSDKKYRNPCKKYEAVYNLAYIYFQYKKDPKKAALYYKITWTIDGSPEWAKNMVATMIWKAALREKSYFMFLDMSKYIWQTKVCNTVAKDLEKIGKHVFSSKKIPWNMLRDIEKMRKKAFPFSDDTLENIKCETYINKAIRELNLYYIEQANNAYFQKFAKNSKDAKELFDSWFLEYLPIDFQQYKDYGIIYFYDTQMGNYNFKMGNYKK